MHRVKNIFHYSILFIFLLGAYFLFHPLFFTLREFGIILVPLLSIILLLFFLREKNYKFVVGYMIVIGIVLFFEVQYRYDRYKVLNTNPRILQHLSRHIIVGYNDEKELEKLIAKSHIGGIFVTRENIQNKSYDEVKKRLHLLQKNTDYHLLIATDHEGGIVSKLSPLLSKLPALSSIDLENKIEIINYATIHAQELSALGINVNFAPVVDLKYHNPDKKLYLHTQIEKRAISSDPLVVSRVATLYTKILQEYQVQSTLKHFPGIAKVINDTHHFSATLDTPIETLQKSDWIPFRTTLEDTNAFLMLSHVLLTSVDSIYPVSTSKKVVQSIIREEWKHKGILVTDDMSMGAIVNSDRGICGSSIDSLNAGVDILLISYDFEKYYTVMSCLIDAYENNILDKEMLEISDSRIHLEIH